MAIFKGKEFWSQKAKPHQAGSVVHDPYGGMTKAATPYEMAFQMAQNCCYWGQKVQVRDPITGKMKEHSFSLCVECPTSIEVGGKKVAKHGTAKPMLCSKGCISQEADPVNPSKIYLTRECFYLDQWHYDKYCRKRLDFEKSLFLGCHHCINDHIQAIQKINPELFVDLTQGGVKPIA